MKIVNSKKLVLLMDDCIFCKFVKKEIEVAIVFENDYVLAFLDTNPAGKLEGHTLVIPKIHCATIDECDNNILCETIKAIKLLVPAIKQVSGAQGINVIQNNGKAAGQFINHLHFHLIPREIGDGIRFDENRRNIKPMEQLEVSKAIKEALLHTKQ